jgi:hypothetical protein
MGARELLTELADAGMSVTLDGDRLLVWPRSMLTDDWRVLLREAKPELIALLSAEHCDLAPALPADLDVAAARAAMYRLGYCDAEAEAQLHAVLQTVPAATVAADLQAIGDERGLPPIASQRRP